jgi:hypothetical protein
MSTVSFLPNWDVEGRPLIGRYGKGQNADITATRPASTAGGPRSQILSATCVWRRVRRPSREWGIWVMVCELKGYAVVNQLVI